MFCGLGGKVRYEVVEVSTMFIHSPSLWGLSLLFHCFVALSGHGFGESNLFLLLMQELSLERCLSKVGARKGLSKVGARRGLS